MVKEEILLTCPHAFAIKPVGRVSAFRPFLVITSLILTSCSFYHVVKLCREIHCYSLLKQDSFSDYPVILTSRSIVTRLPDTKRTKVYSYKSTFFEDECFVCLKLLFIGKKKRLS